MSLTHPHRFLPIHMLENLRFLKEATVRQGQPLIVQKDTARNLKKLCKYLEISEFTLYWYKKSYPLSSKKQAFKHPH